MSSNDLFSQASTQLNFLLLSQRTMVLISAFTVAFANFTSNATYPLSKYLIIVLFSFSIAYGMVAVSDFNKYISDTKKDYTGSLSPSDQRELDLLNTFEKWTYFSYTLVAIIVFIMLTYAKVEFFNVFQRSLGLRKIQ
jgi:predicted MPP superfamily phosphohydrolase